MVGRMSQSSSVLARLDIFNGDMGGTSPNVPAARYQRSGQTIGCVGWKV